jgi:hypothetical protein
MFEIMEQVDKIIKEGYKMVAHGHLDEALEKGSVTPYSGEHGTGYIVKENLLGYPAGYGHYEIFVRGS